MARLTDEMEVTKEQVPRLTQGTGKLLAVSHESSDVSLETRISLYNLPDNTLMSLRC
jgi:hypothetical protein